MPNQSGRTFLGSQLGTVGYDKGTQGKENVSVNQKRLLLLFFEISLFFFMVLRVLFFSITRRNGDNFGTCLFRQQSPLFVLKSHHKKMNNYTVHSFLFDKNHYPPIN